jgi:5-methylcytosine-specific restriction endonuclease McrA
MADKRCVRCDTAKAPDAFPENGRLLDGRDSWCRECRRVYMVAYYLTHKAAYRTRAAQRYVPHPRPRREPRPKMATGGPRTLTVPIVGVCVVCAANFDAARAWSRYCSETCRTDAHHARNSARRAVIVSRRLVCDECDGAYEGSSRRRFCSDACATKYHRDADRDRRRAVSQGKVSERVFRRTVFARDGWTCQLCGRTVDRSVDHPSPLSPSLDHVVPLAAGGSHTYSNVQLAHLGCNIRKGAHVAA